MTTTQPAWLQQPFPFKLAHTWAKSTLIKRMRQIGMTPDTNKPREQLLLDLAIGLKTFQERQNKAKAA